MLLQDGPKKGCKISPEEMSVIAAAIKILNNVALLDLEMFQESLGSPENKLAFFHIVYQLLTLCTVSVESETFSEKTKLLHEAILLVGLYVLKNPKNQELVRWGKSPSILQQLITLPFLYFSDPK